MASVYRFFHRPLRLMTLTFFTPVPFRSPLGTRRNVSRSSGRLASRFLAITWHTCFRGQTRGSGHNMTRRANREVGFLFVNVGDPSQLREVKQRRLVRSHVSALQHARCRRDDPYHPAYRNALLASTGSTAAYRQAVPHYHPTSQAELSASITATEASVRKPTCSHHSGPASPSAIKPGSTTSICTVRNHKAQASTTERCLKQLSLQTIVPESKTWRHQHTILSFSSRLPLYAELKNPPDKFNYALRLLDIDL